MNRRHFLSGATAGVASILGGAAAEHPSRPNIVVILADDFGFGSLNCNGADRRLVRTPNLDRLATEGVRFTDANTPSSVCSPSRYALVTGRYCWRTSLQNGVLSVWAPLHIETTRPNLGSMLKAQGYQTAAIGKWHLGYQTEKTDYTKPLTPGPLQIGFDYHFAIPSNHGDVTGVFVENEGVAGLRSARVEPFGKSFYNGRPYMGIDAPQRDNDTALGVLTDHAVDWLGKQSAKKPFFLYFTPVAVHEPTTPSTATRGSSGAGAYGDWIHDLDRSVGRVLKTLDDKGFTKDTLVIFTSDNGGVFVTTGDRPEAIAYQAGLHVNGAWRGGKHGIYQGGFRVPFLVRWPGKAPAGTTCDETINLVDVFATLAAVTGQPMPAPDVGAEDSTNVLPAFLGKKLSKPLRDSMISHSSDGIFAIRQGPWKYIEGKPSIARMPNARKGEAEPQLYNLKDDPAEEKNVLPEHPEIAARMVDLLSTQRARKHSRRE